LYRYDACDMTVPHEFEDKVLMLNGYELDACNGIAGASHWEKATATHLVAVKYALSVDSQLAMILEQDSMTSPEASWLDGNWRGCTS
jgi:hypothetical protein